VGGAAGDLGADAAQAHHAHGLLIEVHQRNGGARGGGPAALAEVGEGVGDQPAREGEQHGEGPLGDHRGEDAGHVGEDAGVLHQLARQPLHTGGPVLHPAQIPGGADGLHGRVAEDRLDVRRGLELIGRALRRHQLHAGSGAADLGQLGGRQLGAAGQHHLDGMRRGLELEEVVMTDGGGGLRRRAGLGPEGDAADCEAGDETAA
jgi:hypothetical protein